MTLHLSMAATHAWYEELDKVAARGASGAVAGVGAKTDKDDDDDGNLHRFKDLSREDKKRAVLKGLTGAAVSAPVGGLYGAGVGALVADTRAEDRLAKARNRQDFPVLKPKKYAPDPGPKPPGPQPVPEVTANFMDPDYDRQNQARRNARLENIDRKFNLREWERRTQAEETFQKKMKGWRSAKRWDRRAGALRARAVRRGAGRGLAIGLPLMALTAGTLAGADAVQRYGALAKYRRQQERGIQAKPPKKEPFWDAFAQISRRMKKPAQEKKASAGRVAAALAGGTAAGLAVHSGQRKSAIADEILHRTNAMTRAEYNARKTRRRLGTLAGAAGGLTTAAMLYGPARRGVAAVTSKVRTSVSDAINTEVRRNSGDAGEEFRRGLFRDIFKRTKS